jgi:hypothetical protein
MKQQFILAASALFRRLQRADIKFAFIALGIWQGFVTCSPSDAGAAEYEVGGRAQFRWYASGTTQEQVAVFFRLSVRNCSWYFTYALESNNLADYMHVSHDGSQLFFVQSLETVSEKKRKAGAIDPTRHADNSGTASISEGEIFYNAALPEVPPVWLAYGSSCFFDSHKEELVEPAMVQDGTGVEYGRAGSRKLKALRSMSDHFPFLPTRVVYLSDGQLYDFNGKLIRYEPPYDHGFTNAVYEVHSITNHNGLELPLRSSLKLFDRVTNAMSASDLRAVGDYQIQLLTVKTNLSISSFQPPLPGRTVVADHRFYGRENPQYFMELSNQWRSQWHRSKQVKP